ncbi:MAG TPA: dihydroorotate dehydrogenase [Chloroflexota bacterium]|jgi:dihydroorotate dehydrogenase (NAD+) catalytic subunit
MATFESPVDLSVAIGVNAKAPLHLKNPVLVASGTFGYGTEYATLFDIQKLGAIVCKSITLRPRTGLRGPRVAETPAGMLNAIGLQNIGVRRVIKEKAPIWATWDVPVIVNIAGETVEDFAALAEALDGVPGVSGFELNISCPNLWEGGRVVGEDAETTEAITAAVRERTGLPVLVKLSPQVADICGVARAAEAAGADALSLINTLVGMKIDTQNGRPVLANVTGGLSGPAIHPVAVWLVYAVSQVVSIPVIGLGGIASIADALEFLMAGASAVEVGTSTFVEPNTAVDIVEGLGSELRLRGIESIREIIGRAHPPSTTSRQLAPSPSGRGLG